jgi:hypothetical protein
MLKQLRETVRRKRPELWPTIWILYHDKAPAHKALSVKQFLAQKSITEVEHSPCSPDFALNYFWLFPKSVLKGRRFQDTEDIQKTVTTALKAVPQQEFQNISNSGSIIGLSAQLLKGSTCKVTPLSKL